MLTLLGGDGLVAARHLFHYGYQPTIFYPKPTKNEIFERLANQLRNLDIPFTDDFEDSLKSSNHVVDAIFGGDFKHPSLLMLTLIRFQLFGRSPGPIQDRHRSDGKDQGPSAIS